MPGVVPTGAVVTTSIPYKPIGPWMDGCVPDSIRYVPGRRVAAGQVSGVAVVAPANTSVENDCTRGPCAGGVPAPVSGAPGGLPAMGQVTGWALEWSGGSVVVRCVTSPRPPPNWPTITSEVGTKLPFKNERLFVRLIVRPCPVGTVITTGDQPAGVVPIAAGAAGFNLAQIAVDPLTTAPQL